MEVTHDQRSLPTSEPGRAGRAPLAGAAPPGAPPRPIGRRPLEHPRGEWARAGCFTEGHSRVVQCGRGVVRCCTHGTTEVETTASPAREMKCEVGADEGARSPPPPPPPLLAWSPILLPPWAPAFLPALYPAAFRTAFPGRRPRCNIVNGRVYNLLEAPPPPFERSRTAPGRARLKGPPLALPLYSMKMPGQRSGFHISDILELNEGKGLGAQETPLPELPAYAPPHYPHDLLRHHQPWLSIDHHDTNG
ncbi:Homeobox protein vnd [Eumeta japonica]|uniref:Homeobox protein vnd n=1 Tax=Eumeta variegata TaxID=151549 RepID=A0A4C1UBJ1_EUMVA|nr:Homeobox protein vnd [Eumeta japonica]